MEYEVKIWETEETRDHGISYEYEVFDNLEIALNEAHVINILYDYACVEVIDENKKVWCHYSNELEVDRVGEDEDISDYLQKKSIIVSEYTYVLHKYTANVDITYQEYLGLKNGTINIEQITSKYEIDYGCSEPIYDDTYIDEIIYEDVV